MNTDRILANPSTGESMKSYFYPLIWIGLSMTPSTHHFKGLGMTNLQNEIRIGQKIHNKVAMSM